MFKRREKRSWSTMLWELIYPRGGWTRALNYMKHRLQRLPGTPETIARGVWAGVFTSFTPFFGLHLLIAAAIAHAIRGNVLASLIATFFGNPISFVPIAAVSMSTGRFILGYPPSNNISGAGLGTKFLNAGSDLKSNFIAIFSGQEMQWGGLFQFWHDVFLPYMVGCVLPATITATIMYFISVPLIRAYQNRRKGNLKNKFKELKNKAVAKATRDKF